MSIDTGRFRRGASDGAHAAVPRSVSMVPIVAAAAWLLLVAPCLALECPAPQPAGALGATQETPA